MMIQLLLIQAVTMVLLVVGMRFFFSKQLEAALKRLNRLHEENVVREEELKRQLEEAKAEKEKILSEAHAEAERLIGETRVQADAHSLQIRSEGKVQTQKMLEEGRLELEQLKREVHEQAQREAAQLSMQLLAIVFQDASLESLRSALNEALLQELKKLGSEQFTAQSGSCRVQSARALTDAERSSLAAVLEEKSGRRTLIEETVHPELLAGIVVRMGALTLDGSLRNRLERALPYLQPAGRS